MKDNTVKSIKELLAEIDAKYNKSTQGWNISIGRDPNSGYGNIFISNPVNIWQIKIDSLYKPNPYGVGMKLGRVRDFSNLISQRTPSFGFRPLLPSHLEILQKNLERERSIDGIINEILGTNPVSINQLGKSNFLMGPILHSSFEGYISDRQKELDRKLKRNLDELLFSKGIGYNYI
ncbi:MAG: hypothetical protein ACFFD2_28920 [Promethearchaeota archaeon]